MARFGAPLTDRPKMIVAHRDASYAAQVERRFRLLGWDVYQTKSGVEARRLAQEIEPALVVMGTDLPDESGWISCRKLLDAVAEQRVVLVAPQRSKNDVAFAEFVGASSLVLQKDGANALILEIPESVMLS